MLETRKRTRSNDLDVVGTDVPVTVPDDRKIPNKPVNLEFTE